MPYKFTGGKNEKPCSEDSHREYHKCSATRTRSQINSDKSKYENKFTIRNINPIHENRFDFEILDINKIHVLPWPQVT